MAVISCNCFRHQSFNGWLSANFAGAKLALQRLLYYCWRVRTGGCFLCSTNSDIPERKGKKDDEEQSFSHKMVFIESSWQMVKGTGTCVAKSQWPSLR